MTRALLILLAAATVAAAQPPGKKPEVSSSAGFKPAEMSKLAVIVTAPAKLGGANSTDFQRLVEDAYLECLLAKGHTLAARSDVDSVLREKKFQESGLTEEGAASVGKVLNVPAVLLVRVTELTTNTQTHTTRVKLGARLVSVESGAILWTGNHTDGGASGRSGAGAVLLVTATALAEAFPDKPGAAAPRPIDPKAFPKLAVLTVGGADRRVAFGPRRETPQSDRDRGVEDVFVQVLLKKEYNLVSRTDLAAVMKEQAFQKSGLTEDNAVAAGKLLKVPAVLLVGVTESASEALPAARGAKPGVLPGVLGRAAVGARLVDVASGEVRWVHARYDAQPVATKEEAADLLDAVAKQVAQFLPPGPDSPAGLLEQAVLLEHMGQLSAARRARDAAKGAPEPGKAKGSAEPLAREEQDAAEQLSRAKKLLADDDVYKNDNAVQARPILEEIVKKWPATQAAAEAKKLLPAAKSPKERERGEEEAAERLKYARKLLKGGNENEARNRLEKIVKDSPDTKAAIEARKELQTLGPEK